MVMVGVLLGGYKSSPSGGQRPWRSCGIASAGFATLPLRLKNTEEYLGNHIGGALAMNRADLNPRTSSREIVLCAGAPSRRGKARHAAPHPSVSLSCWRSTPALRRPSSLPIRSSAAASPSPGCRSLPRRMSLPTCLARISCCCRRCPTASSSRSSWTRPARSVSRSSRSPWGRTASPGSMASGRPRGTPA